MADGDAQTGIINSMPMWVKIVSYLGFPIAVACFLGYILFSMLQPHVIDTGTEHKLLRQAAESMAYTNQIMCQNAAADKATAEKCVRPPSP